MAEWLGSASWKPLSWKAPGVESLSLRKEPQYQTMPQIAAFFICKGLKKVISGKPLLIKKCGSRHISGCFGFCRDTAGRQGKNERCETLSNQWCPPSTESIDCKVCQSLISRPYLFPIKYCFRNRTHPTAQQQTRLNTTEICHGSLFFHLAGLSFQKTVNHTYKPPNKWCTHEYNLPRIVTYNARGIITKISTLKFICQYT